MVFEGTNITPEVKEEGATTKKAQFLVIFFELVRVSTPIGVMSVRTGLGVGHRTWQKMFNQVTRSKTILVFIC